MRRLLLVFVLTLVLGGCLEYEDIARFVDEGRLTAKVGILGNLELVYGKSTPELSRALRYFATEKVDAVVFLGNLTAEGYLAQYRQLASVWKQTMPAGVRLIAIRGFEEDKVYEERFAKELDGLGELYPPAGGEFEFGGFRCWMAYAKKYGLDSMPSFYSRGHRALTDGAGRTPAASMAVHVGTMSGVDIPRIYADAPETVAAYHGMLMKVYSSSVELHLLDFSHDEYAAQNVYGDGRRRRGGGTRRGKRGAAAGPAVVAEELGEPLELQRGGDGRFTPSWLDEKTAPEFPDDVAVTWRTLPGVGVAVDFPPVLACNSERRAFAYAVRRGKREKLFLPATFWQSENRAKGRLTCVFTEAEIAADAGQDQAVTVSPLSALGVRGRLVTAVEER